MPLQTYILDFSLVFRKHVFKPFVNFFRSSQIITKSDISRRYGFKSERTLP
jgi:hypothetical protein